MCAGWYPPPPNQVRVFSTATISAKARPARSAYHPPQSPSYKSPSLPQGDLCTFLLLFLLLVLSTHVAAHRTTLGLDIAKPTPVMSSLSTQATKEECHQPQAKHSVVAAVTTVAFNSNMATPSCNCCFHGETLLPADEEELLPPYDCVTDQDFAVAAHHVQEHACAARYCTFLNQESCSVGPQSLTNAAHHDFFLFSSDSGRSPGHGSSVVSCFTDDLPCRSESTEALSLDSRTDMPGTAQQLWESLMRGSGGPKDRRRETLSTDVANWLCKVDSNLDHPCHGEPSLREGVVSADGDRQVTEGRKVEI